MALKPKLKNAYSSADKVNKRNETNRKNGFIIDFYFIAINYRFWDGCAITMTIVGFEFLNRLPIVLQSIQIQFENVDYPNSYGNDVFDCAFESFTVFYEGNFEKKSMYSLAGSRQSNVPSGTPGNFVNNCFFSRSSRFFGLLYGRFVMAEIFWLTLDSHRPFRLAHKCTIHEIKERITKETPSNWHNCESTAINWNIWHLVFAARLARFMPHPFKMVVTTESS